ADLVRPELLSEMKDAGCRQVLIGVETGSPRLLEAVNKRMTVETLIRAAADVHRAGLELYAMMVNGLPGETDEDIRATEKLLRTIRPEYTEFLSYMPYPGTPLYESAIREGFVPPTTLEGWGAAATFDLSNINRMGVTDLPTKKYMDMERRTKRRAVMRSYMHSAMREPLTAPVRGLKYLFRSDGDQEDRA
ncbi:MAG TPA: radical SAM protein, partial [Methanomassiliicoccaceae archaeon]|nr:radical SAM protein [Methanomassiliicoccaceae archaeon]